uniref:Uncharacterized protein n=1 Tax=Lotharella oceanica TaxID=641309 RepID=A0A7S2TUU6_9EUKA|mmetsp:Transcript_29297/g.54846  ORF Transcript_29297/g.54846 Transcript_29297/m.54846 type:complete len:137 (+) Transcript_29297:77-487(+)|eukprot:CAMPEP_0170172706 /NCGR_PEP_ID=MMETSP0040_2-20121228/5968_1 /TAXON_ID=641309 /ORGANISM="Lotharella oceanica, Strain CCMP622" /LENGTH=136 /DNA_ID=CAMNT_0010413511 /DNA_START=53 /DNA_END=463 /DNA_ORIENTATION=-
MLLALCKLITYVGALFEIAVGFAFVFSPEALHNGYEPAAGMESYAFEIFGIACVFWGLVTACKATDKAILAFNVLWNLKWAGYLGLIFAGIPWRSQVAIKDGSWAIVPLTAHGIFMVNSLVAFMLTPSNSAKPKTA